MIVVHYGATKEVFSCLRSLSEINDKEKSVEFIFVDNEEVNKTGKKIQTMFPWINYIKSPYNSGFGGGRNLGRIHAKGKYLLFIDSDIVINDKNFRGLLGFLAKHKNAGLVSPMLINQSGKLTVQASRVLTPLNGIFYLSFINKILPGSPILKKFMIFDWDRKGYLEVGVAQLAGFMTTTDAFDDVGGFDEDMFLYFEENDFSSNLRKKGWKIYYDTDLTIIHLESKGTPKHSDKITKAFVHSRYIYFKKHYGILSALIVEAFARFSKTTLILLGILLLSIFLNFYKIQQTMAFNGEMGYDYMTIRTFVENHQIPLIGPRTSHEWFFIGPLFYWIFGILLPIFHYNVAVGAYFFALVGVASILVCYWVVKKLFGKKEALIASFLISFSPIWINLIHQARFNAITAVLFFVFYYFLVKSVRNGGKSLFTLGIILGVMFSFFPSPILLLPGTVVVIFVYRKMVNKKYFLPGILGFLIPNIPYLIYNATHKFQILIDLFAWVPYRILGFFGFYPKNTASPQVLQSNITGLYTFFQQSYLQNNNVLIFLLFAAVIAFALTSLKKNLPLQILMILSAVSYFGLFLHGDPPEHYYLVIFPVPVILLALFLEKISRKFMWLSILIAGYLLIFNLSFYFSDKWFYVNTVRMSDDMNYVPYSLQKRVVDFIDKDAGSKSFSLERVGLYDYFGESFSLNYQYLLWGLGHKPDQSAKLKYTIYEDTRSLPQNKKVTWIENIAVSKNE